MTITLDSLTDLVDKRVTVKYNDDTELVEVEGTLMAVADGFGIMFRPRGKQMGDLIEVEKIESVEQIAAKAKEIKQKVLKPVNVDDVRAHLADRHGYSLTSVNSAEPALALETHDGIDHEDLGHRHESKSDSD